jgi:hypothetical protein
MIYVIHTRSREQSDFILDKIKVRLAEYSLKVHPEKTRRFMFSYPPDFTKKERACRDHLIFLASPSNRLCAKPNGEKFGAQAGHK